MNKYFHSINKQIERIQLFISQFVNLKWLNSQLMK